MGYLYSVLAFFFLVCIGGAAMHVVTTLSGKFFFMFPVAYTVSIYTLALAQAAGFGAWTSFLFGFINALIFGLFAAFLEARLSKDSFAVLGIAGLFASMALVKSWTSLTNGVLGISGVHRPFGFESLGGMVLLCLVLALVILGLEALCLRTRLSRQWRAMKEAQHVLTSIGLNTQQLSFWTLVVACGVLAIAGMPFAWFNQYVDPVSSGGLPDFLRVISVAVLAVRPKVSYVVGASFFVVFTPEVLRLLDLPSSMMGPLRSITYSILLIVVLFVLQRRSVFTNRHI